MMPGMVGRLMSYADVQYRQEELARQFAESRRGTSRRALRRAARAAHRAAATAPVTVPAPARAAVTPVLPEQQAAHSSSVVLDEHLPAA